MGGNVLYLCTNIKWGEFLNKQHRMQQNYLRIKAYFTLEEPSALGDEDRSLSDKQPLKLLDTDKAPRPRLCSAPAHPALPVLSKVIHKSRALLAPPRTPGRLGVGYWTAKMNPAPAANFSSINLLKSSNQNTDLQDLTCFSYFRTSAKPKIYVQLLAPLTTVCTKSPPNQTLTFQSSSPSRLPKHWWPQDTAARDGGRDGTTAQLSSTVKPANPPIC